MEKMNRNLKTTITKLVIVGMILFLIMSAVPMMTANSSVDVTINFKDQTGDFAPINEKVYIYGHGWKTDGETINVEEGKTIYYRAYYKQGSGLYGLKLGYNVPTGGGTLDVEFQKIEMDFEDQTGDIAGGDKRVYIYHVGYCEDGEFVTVPDSSTVYYRAYYKAGSGLYAPKDSEVIDVENELLVEFRTFTVQFTAGLSYTGAERVYIYHVGYRANNVDVTVPKDSTINYRMYYKQGSGLYGTKGSVKIETGSETFNPNFKTVTMNFVDQDGNALTMPTATGNEQVYIYNIGYQGNGAVVVVPDDSTLYYRAYYKVGSGLYGQKMNQPVAAVSVINVPFTIVDVYFIDQYGDDLTSPPATGNERVYIYHVGYRAQNSQVVVPRDCTLYYRAYYKQGSGLYGPKENTPITGTTDYISVRYKIIEVNLKDQNGEPERQTPDPSTHNERAYIYHIGYVKDGDELVAPLGSKLYNRAYYKQGSGLYGPLDKDDVVTCTWDVLNVEYKTLTLKFVDQDGVDLGTGDARIYIYHIGYRQNGDTIMVPLNSKLYYRAYYKQGSGLYGPKLDIQVDCSFEVLEVTFKRITIDLTACILKGTEKIYMYHVGYLGDGAEVILPLDCKIYYRAYYKQGSGLYGPKLDKDVDCSWEVLTVEFWTVKFRVEQSTVLVSGAQIYVYHVGYIANDGTCTVPMGSTVYFKGKVGSTWSTKYNKLVEKKWNLAIIEWDGSAFTGLNYYTEVTFKFYDQDGPLSSSTAFTGNERVYIRYYAQYVTDGFTYRVASGTTIQYKVCYKQTTSYLCTGYISTQALTTNIMFKTITFDFKDQIGDLSGTGNERVYIRYAALYLADTQAIAIPMGATLEYKVCYKATTSYLCTGYKSEPVDCDEGTLDVYFKTITFDFKDQNGDLTGTSNERVYIRYADLYLADTQAIAVPMGATVEYRVCYKATTSYLCTGYKSEPVDCDEDILEVYFKTITFDFWDQNGDLTGTGNERVYIRYADLYLADTQTIAVPMGATLEYRVCYKATTSYLCTGYKSEPVNCDEDTLQVFFKTITFDFKDQNGDLTGTGNERVYIRYANLYLGDTQSIAIPVGATLEYRGCYKATTSYLCTGYISELVDCDEGCLVIDFWTVSFQVVDQTSNLIAGAQIYIRYANLYLANDETISLPVGSTVEHRGKVGTVMTGYKSKSVDKTWTQGVHTYDTTTNTFTGLTYNYQAPYTTTAVTFKFVDQDGCPIPTTHTQRIKIDGVSGYFDDGYTMTGLTNGQTIKYTPYYSSSSPGYYIAGTQQSFNWATGQEYQYVEFHRVLFKFVDQGNNPLSGTDHRIEIKSTNGHSIGYREHCDVEYFPLGSTVKYWAKYSSTSPGYHIVGSQVTYNADSTVPIEHVKFHRVKFNFVDQYDNVLSGTNHRIEIKSTNGHSIGYRAHGAVEYFPLGSTIHYWAKYAGNSPGYHIVGSKVIFPADSTVPIEDVEFHRVTFNFVDQDGNVLSGTNHRIEIKSTNGHSIGYREHGDVEYFPLGSTIHYWAKYAGNSPGYHIVGSKVIYDADSNVPVEDVEFHRVTFVFRDQYGNELSGTAHRIEIKSTNGHSIGYRANGAVEYFPLGATVHYWAKYAGNSPGYHIVGSKVIYLADSNVPNEIVEFHRVTFIFKDQFGDDIKCTDHRIEIKSTNGHSIGYRKDGDTEWFPKGATINYWAKYSGTSPGYHIVGSKVIYLADSCTRIERVYFHKVTFQFEDQYGNEISGTQHRIQITSTNGHSIGYRANGAVEYFPLGSTVRYWAKYSGTSPGYHIAGPQQTYAADSIVPIEKVKFQELICRVKDSSGNLISGAKIYIYSSNGHSVGGINNGATVIIPLDASIKHRGFVPINTYSATSPLKTITKDIIGINYVWDGSTWSGPIYNLVWYVDASYSGTETGSQTQPFDTIGEAVTAAIDGDRIMVAAGTYNENANIGKSLTVIGADRDTTIIDGGESGDVVHITAGGTIFKGFTVTNAGTTDGLDGIEINNADYCRIEDVNASDGNHIGIRLTSSNYCVINNNHVTNNILGIYSGWSTNNEFGFNYINNNPANGIQLASSVSTDSWVHNNTVIKNGVYGSPTGGIFLWGSGSKNNIIEYNYIDGNNDGIHFRASGITGNIVHDNTITNCLGAGVRYTHSAGPNTFYHNSFINNAAQTVSTLASDTWDNGYPSGGNYWDTYTGVDVKKGAAQNIAGADGIGDTAYSVPGGGTDNYPWMYQDGGYTWVYLLDSDGNFMDTGINIKYKVGSTWHTFGAGTTSGGRVNAWIPSGSYYFTLTHAESSTTNTKYQNIGSNPIVVFQTELVTMELRCSKGCLMDTGSNLRYKIGNNYPTFGSGSTSGGAIGQETMEMLPGSYYFYLTHTESSTSGTIYQNIGTNPTVTFQTVKVTIELRKSDNTLMDTGSNLRYKIGNNYPTFGSGSTSGGAVGQETDELLPGSYYFYLTHSESSTSGTIYQNIGTNPTVTFQTVKVTMELRKSDNTLMDTGSNLRYQIGSNYPTFGSGSTSGGAIGQETDELLPGSYYFYLTHTESATSGQIYQNIGTNPTVTFQTVKVTMELRDSSNTLMDTGSNLRYKIGGNYPTFGSGSTSGGAVGQETDELLPGSYYFYLTHSESSTSGSIYQNIGTNPTVTFKTAKVISDSGKCTDYKVGSTWYTFNNPIQMLTGSYYFKFSDIPTQYIAIVAGENHIY